MSYTDRQWFATCPKGLQSLLFEELKSLGATELRETVAGVHFSGSQAVAYRACLWSRLANRVLLPVAELDASSAEAFYQGLSSIDWYRFFTSDKRFVVDFIGQNKSIRNTQFGAQRAKDAIVDWFVKHHRQRPQVDKSRPQVRLNMHLSGTRLQVALDMSGGSLHRRGYRRGFGEAPIKENLAAALLIRAGWQDTYPQGGALIDPMCGSATLLLEGAMMALDIAPALGRPEFGFEHWRDHNAAQWQAIVSDAKSRAARALAGDCVEIRGYDSDARVIRRAQENIAAAGLEKQVRVHAKPLKALTKPTHKPLPNGLLICNPPYGERLGNKAELPLLYAQLGQLLSTEFKGWQGAVVTSDIALGKAMGLRAHKRYSLYNGALPVTLLLFDLSDNEYRAAPAPRLDDNAQMLANRLRKNQRRLSKWLKRDNVQCYRLYDADMPEFAVAIDVYGDYLHVAEYKAPAGIDPAAAARRLHSVMQVLPEVTGIPGERIVLKQRQRQRGDTQYQKQGDSAALITVTEGAAKLLVNLRDYMDTGLFLDHRPLRRRIADEARGKDFLNLFCYTGSATVQAILGGARHTVSVDMSNTYLRWLEKNLRANKLGGSRHQLIRANCVEWLEETEEQFDLIMLDPPSFSNSARMDETFDVQRDHRALVESTMRHLREGGVLYFSNNRRKFVLDEALQAKYDCKDISKQTLDPDFERKPQVHSCWLIRHRSCAR